MNSGIYKILNTINNKFYIGSSINLRCRRNHHFGRLRANEHKNIHLQNSFNKYGEENFIFGILEECEKEKLIEREQYYMDNLDPEYNICKIANSHLGLKHNENTRKIMSEKAKGRKFTEQSRKRMSISAKKRENRVCISKYSKGRDMKGSKSTSALIDDEVARLIKLDLKDGIKIKDIVIKHNLKSRSIVENIKYNNTWSHIEI